MKLTKHLLFNFVLLPGMLACVLSSVALAQEADLPADGEVVSQVVHGIKYPLEHTFSIDVGLAKYYGDRLADTYGFIVEPRYHLSEKNWLSLPVFFGQTSLASGDEVGAVAANGAYIADPSLIVSLLFGHDFIFGKFALNDHINHFRASFDVGPLVAQMQVLSGTAGSANYDVGLQGGGQMQLQFSDHWTTDLFTQLLLIHDTNPGASSSTATIG